MMEKPFKFALPSPNFNKNAKDAYKPKPHFLTPSGMSLLPREKQPPPMYGKHGATVPPKYLASSLQQPKEELPVKQYCEPCELELQSFEDLRRHRAQHEKCPVEGCKFNGHPSVMDKHVNALHASGLFDKFKKLSTPEEIAAWREERKKRYPTVANVLLKQKAQEQRQKRGERLDSNKNRFGKVNDRKRAQPNQKESFKEGEGPQQGKQQNQRNKRNRKNKRNQKPREQNVKQDIKTEGKEAGKSTEANEACCGGVKMFQGTRQMKDYKHFNDKKKLPVNNALFGLVGMYGSDDESEENDSEDKINDDIEVDVKTECSGSFCKENDVTMEAAGCSDNEKTNDKSSDNFFNVSSKDNIQIRDISLNNNEKKENLKGSNTVMDNLNEITPFVSTVLPVVEEITKETSTDDPPLNTQDNSSDEAPEESPIQRIEPDYSIKTEKVSALQTKEEPLEKRSKPAEEAFKTKQNLAKRKSGLDYRKARLRKQNTMLEKLIETDIRHERNVLLQCVRYVCENNFFGIGENNKTKPD